MVSIGHGHYPGRRLPPRVLPGLSSLGFWDAAHAQTWSTGFHYNEGIELSLVESGQVAFVANNQARMLQPGDATATRPWLRHSRGDPCVCPHWPIGSMSYVGVAGPTNRGDGHPGSS